MVNYLDSRRIMGASTDIVSTPAYNPDFSSNTGWSESDSSKNTVNTSLGRIDFDLRRDTTVDSMAYDLGYALSDTAWTVRFKIHIDNVTNADGSAMRAFIGMSDGNHTQHHAVAQDSIGFSIKHGSSASERLWLSSWSNNASTESNQVQLGNLLNDARNGYDSFIEIKRTSSSTAQVSVSSTDAYDGDIASNSITGISGVTGLRYFVIKNTDTSLSTTTNQTDGWIDDLVIYNGETTNKPAQLLSLSGCKAYYNFEQTSGSLTNIATTANGFADGLGSSADGTNNGATTGVTGKVGSYAWDFDGTNDYVELTSSTSNWNFLHNGGSHSYSYWIKLGNTGGIPEYLLFDISWSGDIGIAMTVNSSDQIQYSIYRGASGTWVVSGASSTSLDTNWHHVAITYDGSNARIYIDGSLDSTIAKTANAPSSSNSTYSLKIGATADITSFADVSLDELAIFNRVLTADEISALYNGGTGVAVNDSSILAKPETNSIFVETDGGRKYLFDGSEWYLTLKGGSGYATRAVFSGGFTGSESNTIDYVTIQTTGNATDFGDLVYARHYVGATSDTSRGVTTGGFDGTSTYSTIDYYTIATPANAQTFGSLTIGKSTYDSCVCDSVNVLQFGGYTGATATATIDYFGIRSLGNASTFGNLATALYAKFGLDDTFRAVTGGGGGYNTVIDYVTMRTPSNSTSFGNLTQGRGWSGATASTTRGVIGGGDSGSVSNVIDYVTIQTTGNATDFGDLSVARAYLSATGDRSRGLFGGGSSDYTNGNNTMDYITISTTGNATDFGDLTVARFGVAGCSGK
jgi:hypothetical protein